MYNYVDFIKNSKLFYNIDESDIIPMLKCLSATVNDYKKGQYIYHIGDKVSEIGLIIEGYIHLQKCDYWGNQSIFSEISKGDIFGEVYACLEGKPIAVNVYVLKDSKILFLNIDKVINLCSSACRFHSQLINNLIIIFAEKNLKLTTKIEHISQRNTRDKLLSYLSEQSLKNNSSTFDIPFNRQQLADYLSVERSAMSNELCKLRNDGIISFHKNHFELI